jgi:PhoPQ-activated pathogenicity-related protein
MRFRFAAAVAVLLTGLVRANAADKPVVTAIPKALFDYIAKPTPEFAWKLRNKTTSKLGTVYHLELTSQKWHGIVWKHALTVYEPKTVKHPDHVLLFVTGGSIGKRPGAGDILMGLKLAGLCKARVAMLNQVPNQPLFGGKKEDDLITETWLRYLKTGDETWPLLFPMVKSAVRAMDAVEQLAKQEWRRPVKGFVVTGASKRGWTSWLTAVADKRILATAPIVINVLNFRAQMKHQIETWGDFSEQIIDYSSKGLIKRPGEKESPREIRLRTMMDPYTYRSRLMLPKLLIHGTNDRYWVVDAMNIYWDDLHGPKYVLQVPNTGHSLKGGRDGALTTLAVFFRHAVTKTPMPHLSWKHGNAGGKLVFTMQAMSDPKAGRLWVAHSATKDFRKSKWKPVTATLKDGRFTVSIPRPKDGYVALFGEMQFEYDGLKYSLSSQIRRN